MVALAVMILCAGLLIHAYAGYPLSLWIMAALRRAVHPGPAPTVASKMVNLPGANSQPQIESHESEIQNRLPPVSIVFSVYNEAAVLKDKLNNCRELDYPRDRLEVVVASDGSEDGSDDILRRFENRGVRWFRQEPRQGKNAALNRLAPELKGEIWVFTDANAMFEPDAVRRLVAHFADPQVGSVSGELAYGHPAERQSARQKTVGGVEAVFWRFDQALRRLESRLGCLTGANGGIFALRRTEWRELDPGVPNDFILCALAAAGGARTVYDPAARAWEAPSERVRQEFDRRVRIITRGLRALALAWKPAWRGRRFMLLYGMICRKWLRRLQPALLMGLLIPNLFLLTEGWGRWLLGLQAAGYAAGLASGLAWRIGTRSKAALLPFYFLALNAAAVVALWRFALGRTAVAWNVQRVDPSQADG